MTDRIVHAIAHTHWDFEWYFTRHEAFIQFCYHMDEVLQALEQGKITYYLLDGQMSILDDYLQAFPEKQVQVKRFVRGKRLFVGPWYTQTDELVIAGESIVRNLNLGLNLADRLGGAMMVGYLPDSFGQGKDMPKIYNGLAITDALFWRGVPSDVVKHTEFNWQAEDGSKVLVENIKNGYFAGVPLVETMMNQSQAQRYLKQNVCAAATQNTALPVGGDQRYVDLNLTAKIAQINRQNVNQPVKVVESNYPALFTAIRQEEPKLETLSGEFIDASVSKIHRSIYSSRYDQKYLNDKLERRLLYTVEPLMIFAAAYGIPYHQAILDKIWRLMVRNHAHDSAGGCNSDKTNQDILNRLNEADQLSYSVIDYLTRKLSISQPQVQQDDLIFYNPRPVTVKKIIQVQLSVKQKAFCLSSNGKRINYDLIASQRVYGGTIRRNPLDNDPERYYYVHTVRLPVNIAPMAQQKIHIDACQYPKQVAAPTKKEKIENLFYELKVDQGKLTLIDKRNEKVYTNILNFEDGGDEGDTYDYSPAYQDEIYQLDFKKATVQVVCGKFSQSLILNGVWRLPQNLAQRAKKQCDGHLPYQIKLTLDRQTTLIQIKMTVDNRIKDHRLRAIIKSDVKAKFIYGDSQFGTFKRAVTDPHAKNWRQLGYHEEPTTIFPMLHYINAHNGDTSLTIMTKGIKEYQAVGTEFDQLALTLYRSVGYLGRPDLRRRPGIASGNEFKAIPTPDSQLQKQLTFKFAIHFDKVYRPHQLMQLYQSYASRVPYYQIQNLNRFTTTLQYFVLHPTQLTQRCLPIIDLKNTKLVFSSLQATADQGGMALRVYNPSLTTSLTNQVIELDQAARVCQLNLRGQPLSAVQVVKKIDCGSFTPGEIKTFGIY